MNKKNKLMQYIQEFFKEYLAAQKGLSSNTIRTYRDSLKLFLSFAAAHSRKATAALTLDDLNTDNVILFLKEIEQRRGNSPITRNLRLASLKTFFTYLISQDISHAGEYQKIITISQKRVSKPLVEYLEVAEVKAILKSIGKEDDRGERDFAILNLLYNTGARVSEICNLRVGQIRFDIPPLVTVMGKGQKLRHIPLWEETATILYKYISRKCMSGNPDSKVFLNARGKPLTRFGIYHIICKRAAGAAVKCPSLSKKKISPHTFRHTTAMHLLQSGVDLSVIKNWLGHVNLSTTHSYIEIDLEMKRKALSSCNSIAKSFNLNQWIKKNEDVISWLEAL